MSKFQSFYFGWLGGALTGERRIYFNYSDSTLCIIESKKMLSAQTIGEKAGIKVVQVIIDIDEILEKRS